MPSPSHPVASVHDRARLCVNPAFPAVTDAPSRTVAHTQTALLPPYPRIVRAYRCDTIGAGKRWDRVVRTLTQRPRLGNARSRSAGLSSAASELVDWLPDGAPDGMTRVPGRKGWLLAVLDSLR